MKRSGFSRPKSPNVPIDWRVAERAMLRANLKANRRGATGEYDQKAADEIRRMGYGIAGFSVNADSGATLSRASVQDRLRHVKAGDVIIAHMNRPSSGTAEGMSAGLIELLRRGLVFVRLDQIQLTESGTSERR